MTQFRTPVEILPPPWSTGYAKKHVLIGSCFTENIGTYLEALKFQTDINPFGIVYNPVSIASSLRRLLSGNSFDEKELTCHSGWWYSFSHHGSFSADTPALCLQKINERLATSSPYLRDAGFLILTFGTAWVYELQSTGQIVANCHKVPTGEFRRFRLSVNEIVTKMRETLEILWNVNPGIKVVFTVSPIRHLSDGAAENQLSKATLLLATEALIRGFGNEKCCYFPAYELVMDELRDYRFYDEDMVHLSSPAVNFIREKFCSWLVADKDLELAYKIEQLLKARNHRPLNKKSPEYYAFLQKTAEKLSLLSENHPSLDFSDEKDYFARELETFRSSQT